MFSKILNFLFMMGINGIVAILGAVFICIIIVIALAFATIPVMIIAGSETAKTIMSVTNNQIFFPIIYTTVFLSLMAEDLGIPGIKTLYAEYKKKRAS